jgi:crotonobetaine/carnitine-CoA ligase
MNQSKRDDDSDNPLERVLILPNPPRMTEAFLKRFGVKQYFAGFGQTEVGVLSAKACNEDAPSDSAGKVCKKRYDVRVFDENDNELPPGKVGEFVLRPHEAYTILSGYYNKPEKTLECLRNVWFHTGDGGYITEDEYLYFTDRVKDYIRRRGENISSYEIERTIDSHPSVEESAVIGVKSEYGGLEEEVKVCIVLKEGKALKPEELMVWCEERMPYYLIPRYVEFMDKLPKTPTEKVEKYKLRKFGVTEGTWDREKAGYKIKK